MIFEELVNHLRKLYPEETAEAWDQPRIGLQFYDCKKTVKKVLLALDLTTETFEEALKNGADTIITHHPFFFYPVTRVDYTDPRMELMAKVIERKINVYSMHTNLDKGLGGVNDTLLEVLFPKAKVIKKNDYLRVCEVKETTCDDVGKTVINNLNLKGVKILNPRKFVTKVGLFSGAGGTESVVKEAFDCGCDLLITGEFKLSSILYANEYGLGLIEISHGTEAVVMTSLAKIFKELKIDYLISNVDPDPIEYRIK